MRGLICKEFIYFKRQNLLVWVFFIFCAYTFTRLGPSRRSTMMWEVNICVLTSLLGVSLLAFGPFYDEKSHWDRFVRSLPIRSRRIVESRYLCAALIIAAGALLTIGATLVTANGQTDWDTFTRICSFSVGFPAILFSIFLPLCYALPSSAMSFAGIILSMPFIIWDMLYQGGKCADPFSLFAPLPFLLVSAVIMAASFFLSVRIYSQKEM